MSSLLAKSPVTNSHVGSVHYFFGMMKRVRIVRAVAGLFLSWQMTAPLHAQLYAGMLGGISTLSGDSHSVISPGSVAFSSYDPRNGGVAEILVGKHFSDYFTAQANYIWNGNGLTLTSATFSGSTRTGYEERRRSTEQSVIGDFLVYFRARDSRFRPYLSVGTGFAHFASSQESLQQVLGNPNLPPQKFSTSMVVLHVPVGIDVKLGKGWALRYTFSETLSKNPISPRLSPPGKHRLMNFQNLFGFVRRF